MKTNFKLLLVFFMLTSSIRVFALDVNTWQTKPTVQITINVGQKYEYDFSKIMKNSYNGAYYCHCTIGDESIVTPMGFLRVQSKEEENGNGYYNRIYDNMFEGKKFRFVGTKQGRTTIELNIHEDNQQYMTSVVLEITVKDSKPEMLILQKSLQMEVDDTQTLTPAFYPSGTSSNVTWYSTNSSVVSVEGGQLTAKAVGQATITCITDNGLREDCNVTVTPKLAQAISMNTSRVTLMPGDTYQFATTITPETDTQKRVVWRSLNPNVVSVDENGLAQCIGEGWTLVTATTTDGTYLTTGCFVQAGKNFDGDLNNDNQIDVSDVNLLIDIILGKA